MVKVKDIMTCEVYTIIASESVASAILVMGRSHVDCLAVETRDGKWGIITASDISTDCVDAGHDLQECRVYRHTLMPIRTLDPETSLVDATILLIEDEASYIPVVKRDHLVGIVTSGMITAAIRRVTRRRKPANDWKPIKYINPNYVKSK